MGWDDAGMSPALVAYEHFLGIAARIEWNADAIDLGTDAENWARLDPEASERVVAFLAAFELAEERVAADLEPFIAAATNPGMAACFRTQACDEERHARFFARYAREVLGSTGLAERIDPAFAELFQLRLHEAAGALAVGRLSLADAVALYHLVLEGVVFSAGQSALLAQLDEIGTLPGLAEGLRRVLLDERWHIGLGVRALRDSPGAGGTLPDAERAVRAWGPLLSAEQREAALRLHRRRLAAAGLQGLSSTPSPPSTPLATATS
jgi:ribonucleoside-diphosphate reductase beta chain